jgi:secondary thiamine-phosphate synthase enzyme
MKTLTKEIWMDVPRRRQIISIHHEVEQLVAESGVQEGIVLVNAMHITASVFINDNESGLHHDYELWLEKLAPEKPHSQYRHNGYEDNADAHMKRQVMGREVVVAITCIWGRGSTSFTTNLTANAENDFWSRSSGNNHAREG